jgi:hypothetical protein
MKSYLSLVFVLLSTIISIGQPSKGDSEMNSFMNTIIGLLKKDRNLWPDTNNIYLASNSPEYLNQTILSPDTLKDTNKPNSSKYFILTNEERSLILVDSMKWSDIPKSFIQLNKMTLVHLDTIKKINDPLYLLYKPIFLRNNKICLFYYEFICTACGNGTFWLYKKEKGGWQPWIEIGSWVN